MFSSYTFKRMNSQASIILLLSQSICRFKSMIIQALSGITSSLSYSDTQRSNMFVKVSFLSVLFFFCRLLLWNLKRLRRFHRSYSNHATHNSTRFQNCDSLVHRPDLAEHTLVFHVEGALLKSCSLFSYFMLVAFEAGGLIRATILLLLYPFICLVGDDVGLKTMVMVCFFGIKKENFRVGRTVLPKFFLENVAVEIFEVLEKGKMKVGISDLPQVMVESFLQEYLDIDHVIGRQLKVLGGFFVGLMEDNKSQEALMIKLEQEINPSCNAIGIAGFKNLHECYEVFSLCKELFWVARSDKRCWKKLPREKYPKPLIFHDGRLAMRPTPLGSIAIFMWIPFGFVLSIVKIIVAVSLPYSLSTPLLSMSGLRLIVSTPHSSQTHTFSNPRVDKPNGGKLYVCNHRTLLDPLYLSFTLKKNLIAVTYSLSRMSEIIAPIKTVRLTRNHDEDAKMMKKLLSQGDTVVCPEGTTCREPYLLRFSPLFSEMSDEIIPVAIDTHVSMFHGTTAGGLKCLDPILFLMNPWATYTVELLDMVPGLSNSVGNDKSRFEVANHVQSEIAKALNFKCTKLTRKDKYMVLAGNQGIVSTT